MKKIFTLTFLLVFSTSLMAQKTDEQLTAVYQKVAFSLFKEVADANDGNLCFSPISLQLALSMVQNGAAENTLKQIRSAMGTSDFTDNEVNEYNQTLAKKLTTRPEFNLKDWNWYGNEEEARKAYDAAYPICELANGIWTRPDVILLDSFISLIKEFYDAGFGSVDFTTVEGIQVVNDWVNQKTHGLIKKIFNEPQSEDLAVVLANALYFKGSWQNQFDEYETKPDSFHIGGGTAIMADMMLAHTYFNTSLSDKFRTITLPYGYDDFSMTLFVPVKGTKLPELTANDWKEGFTIKNRYTPYNLYFPKFVIDGNYDLVPVLKNMGMLDAFNPLYADFSRMREIPVFISDAFQLSKISVDEEGTEAAAVTVFSYKDSAIPDYESYKDFKVDRPFYFTIENRKTETVLFVGRVTELDGPRVKDVSGIDLITVTESNKPMYDLSGRRINHIPQKGIYIQNGKKYYNR